MMGWLALVVGVLTTLWLGLIDFANMMSDAPTVQMAYWPWALGGYGLAAALLIAWKFW